jgi:hypothetical protein
MKREIKKDLIVTFTVYGAVLGVILMYLVMEDKNLALFITVAFTMMFVLRNYMES